MENTIQFHHMQNRSKSGYVTWGAPWAKGVVENCNFNILADDNKEIPMQSKVTAYWPDGSIKWSSHTIDASQVKDTVLLSPVKGSQEQPFIKTTETSEYISVDADGISAVFPKSGTCLIKEVIQSGRCAVSSGEAVCIIEERSELDGDKVRREVTYTGNVHNVTVEDIGVLKCVIKVEGIHKSNKGRDILPFIIRFIFHKNDNSIQMAHTFLYDGDADKDFIKGLGVNFKVPTEGALYNRHVKIAGDFGFLHEPLVLMQSWRPRIDPNIYKKQINGEILTTEMMQDENVSVAIKDMTIWDSYRLSQVTSASFEVKKRTSKESCSFINANNGKRSKGLIYTAGEKGGIALGMKNFWQTYPSSLWAENLSSDEGSLTAWFWSPESEAMDFRHYDTVAHSQSYYEGFDEVGSTPYGIASTTELSLFLFEGDIATDAQLDECAMQIQKGAMLIADPEYYHKVKAMGEWSLIEKDTPLKKWLEEQLDIAVDFYKNEVEQRNWYGLFNYGDFMHTYDKERHCWKYDMGGYAWQNTELVPTLWLWFAFFRSGRGDIFTLAEAMSRHTSEVDTYHLGKYKGLGSRHNVIHWGDSCKEPRIAMAGHHRAYYYLTGGDYRMHDVFDDVKDGDFATLNIDPLRFFFDKSQMKMPTHARSGPDWSSYCANWLTQWEMSNNEHYRDKIKIGIEDLKKTPLGLISGTNYEYDPESGHLGYIGESKSGSHLAISMGGPQAWFDIAECLDDPVFTQMIAEYGAFYLLTKEEKIKKSGGLISGQGFAYPYMATGIAAYAAKYYNDEKLGYKVWQVLVHSLAGKDKKDSFEIEQVQNYFNKESLDEMFWISTNFTAQWCLNTIVALELAKDFIPENKEDCEWAEWIK